MVVRSKKGDMFQVLFMLAILTGVAIVGLICLYLATNINNFWDSSGLLNNTAVGTQAINQLQDTAPKTTDYAVLFLFIGLNIGILISAVKTNFSPIVIFLFILLALIAIMISAGMVNIYQGLAQQPDVLSVSSGLTYTNFIFSKYLPLTVSIICALVMLIMWGKSGGEFP